MDAIKGAYVGLAHRLGALAPAEQFMADASARQAGSVRRWLASLMAIYHTERMIALDCPWWNVAATKEVEDFLARRPEPRVFEWGAGASTAWLARRASEVISVEHDPGWYARFREQIAPFTNVQLLHRSLEENGAPYLDAIETCAGSFDLIVIDGRRRADCLERAMGHLAAGGMILFDDSGRKRYRAPIERSGLIERHHRGRSYCVPYPDHTSLLLANG